MWVVFFAIFMNVFISKGKGHGNTSLSAFDAALKDAGVFNYNLIVLSSIIPKGTKINLKKFKSKKDEYGYKLYVIKAEKRGGEVGLVVGAALGWYQEIDGRGAFVEHTETGRTEQEVEGKLKEDVEKSIMDLCKSRKFKFDRKKLEILTSITKVRKRPACALVIAVYQSEGWK